jgi:hypothetical protein
MARATGPPQNSERKSGLVPVRRVARQFLIVKTAAARVRTRRRRRVGGRIRCGGARADRGRRRCSGGLFGRSVDFTFMGPAPLERTASGAESREPGRPCPCRRQSTCAQSVCAHRSSSSSSGCPSTAVRHHHGFHRAAGPATRVSILIGRGASVPLSHMKRPRTEAA